MIIPSIKSALLRARIPIFTVAATYFVFVLTRKDELLKGLADFGGNSSFF
ncbi:MAG: hypothetical protein Q8N37_03790 [bacterium]|nr:hypothetical protein [bacterium]